VDSPQPKPPDPDQLFSKPGAIEPAGPQMLGARNVDSVLFNIKDLDVTKPAAAKQEASAVTQDLEDPPGGSGLIDVSKLVPESPDGKRHPPKITTAPAPGSIVAQIQQRPVPQQVVVRPTNKTQTYIMVAAILALLGVAILLAIKALN
jgi:hypothetical protein